MRCQVYGFIVILRSATSVCTHQRLIRPALPPRQAGSQRTVGINYAFWAVIRRVEHGSEHVPQTTSAERHNWITWHDGEGLDDVINVHAASLPRRARVLGRRLSSARVYRNYGGHVVHGDVTTRQRKSIDQRHRYGVVTHLLCLRHPLRDLTNNDDVCFLCDVA